MIEPASTLVLFNKNIANFTHKRWENQCSKFFGFFTALLVDRCKRGRLRHRGVVDQFIKRYPNIKVNVFDNNGKAIKHNGEE